MTTKLRYPKFLTITFLILPVMSMLSLQAQDILISFAGAGESTSVDSVKVENLTQGTKLKMKGSDVLRLMGTTGIETISDNEGSKIVFYPNPMKDYSQMQFVLSEQGGTVITLYDISGRKIAQTRDLLSKGQHTYALQGVKEGVYFVTISSGRYSLSGKLISSGSKNGSAKIEHESSVISQEKQTDSKGTNEEKVMQYNTGDRLKLIGISGIYSTLVTDVPTASKTITYNFITCTDGDGNNYPVVEIGTGKSGTQGWMAENLKTTRYNNGTAIPLVTDNASWFYLKTPGYCWYNNDEAANKATNGALYNWYTVNTGNLCPTGWHVPTDAEWKTLATAMGDYLIAGGKLKETGTAHWISPNKGATNESGFTALPAGARSGGTFAYIGSVGSWWVSNEYSSVSGWCRDIDHDDTILSRYVSPKVIGLSVRCLRD